VIISQRFNAGSLYPKGAAFIWEPGASPQEFRSPCKTSAESAFQSSRWPNWCRT